MYIYVYIFDNSDYASLKSKHSHKITDDKGSVLCLNLYRRPTLSYLKVKCVGLRFIKHTHGYLSCYFKMVVAIRERSNEIYMMMSYLFV